VLGGSNELPTGCIRDEPALGEELEGYGHLLRAGLYSGTDPAHLPVPHGFRICLWSSPELSLDTQEEILRLLECHQRLPQPARSRNLIVEAHAS
jgi:hypothetical protein